MIHIIWSGKGFLVAVLTFGCSLAANLICNLATGTGAYWETHKWPLAVSLFVSAAACWSIGRHLRKQGRQVLIDPQTGKEVVLQRSHTLFFIPVMWWGPILGVFGLLAFGMEFMK